MEVDVTFTINQALRENTYCFCYKVYWKDNITIDTNLWKSKCFHNLKEAKAFAKKKWEQYKKYKLKPYILEKIVRSDYFKEELFYDLKIVDKEKYEYNYVRRAW
jgi:hypothetical protein